MSLELTNTEIDKYCVNLRDKIVASGKKYNAIYPVPMGGYPVALKLYPLLNLPIIDINHGAWKMDNCDILIVDDIVDSGKTLSNPLFENYDTACLISREHYQCNYYGILNKKWIVFPWEKAKGEGSDIHDHIIRQMEYIGENVTREGLIGTPDRVVRSWGKIFGGYDMDPKDLLTTFENPKCDEMVILKDIEMYSTCEHHILPFFGKCSIAYIPKKKVIGISKLARLMEVFARRMQIQERIGEQITEFIMEELDAIGAACIIEAQHFCMTSRGVQKQHSVMITSSLKGAFKTKPAARAELMSLIKG